MSAIDAADLNMAQGVALCRVCGDLKSLSDIMSVPTADEADAAKPPAGCHAEDWGGGMQYVASIRSVSGAVFTGLFALFWNGILSVFLVVVAGGIYSHFIGPLPKWFPALNGPKMPVSEVLFMCVFLTPFLLVGTGMIIAWLVCMFGKVVVRIENGQGTIRTGVGALAWTRRFDAAAVKSVRYGQTSYLVNNQTKPLIIIESTRTLKFGSGLSDRRRKWLAAVLSERLVRN